MSLTTGIELELLLPPGMTRMDLLERLRAFTGGQVQPFEFPSKVPVPHPARAGLEGEAAIQACLAAMQDIAAHHQARLHSIRPDGQFFYLSHRCGRLVDEHGMTLLEVVHDNTLAGGERVAEVITPPLAPEQADWLAALIAQLAAVPGIEVPPRAALHVHVDGKALCDAETLARLVALYLDHEALLRRWLHTPTGLHADRRMPHALLRSLHAGVGQPWEQVRPTLARALPDNCCGLNLYNLAHDRRDKLTVELKLAAASLDPAWVLAVRALFVALVELALACDVDLPRDAAALVHAIDPADRIVPVLAGAARAP
ncbi:MAG: amidoligase family protein [Pseudomonadota bacterium]